MSKQHVGDAATRRKLEALRDDLFSVRAELQQAYERHDAHTFGILKELERRHKELKDDFAKEAEPTIRLIADMSRRRDNIEARLRGIPPLHKDKIRAGVDLLADARRRMRIHSAVTDGVGAAEAVDVMVDAAEEDALLAEPSVPETPPPASNGAGDAASDGEDEDLAGYEPGGVEAA